MQLADITNKLELLIKQGKELYTTIGSFQGSKNNYFSESYKIQAHEWQYSSSAFLKHLTPEGSYLNKQIENIISLSSNSPDASANVHRRLLALLKTTLTELTEGRLSSWQYTITAQDFDEFLKYAELFHKNGKVMESSVIASAVLEDTIKTIAKKSGGIEASGALDSIIQNLTVAGIFTSVRRSRVQSLAAIRNKAFHAEWEELDLKIVGSFIKDIRDLIDEYLTEPSH